MGPPGALRQENATVLAEHFAWKFISTGDLLRKEMSKKTPEGDRIAACLSSYKYGKSSLTVSAVSKSFDTI